MTSMPMFKKHNKWIVNYDFVTSFLTFKGSIPIDHTNM